MWAYIWNFWIYVKDVQEYEIFEIISQPSFAFVQFFMPYKQFERAEI